MTLTIYALFFVLIIISIYVATQNNHINALLSYGAFGTILSLLFFTMNAPDVAIVNLTVGAAFVFFIYVIAIKKVGKIKVYFVKTPYLVDKDELGNLYGFEYYLIKEFLDEKRMDVDFIEVSSKTAIDNLKNNGDILIGGFIFQKFREDIVCSEKFLPTKMISIGDPKVTDYNVFYKKLEQDNYLEFFNDFTLDFIRYKHLLYLGKKFNFSKEEESNNIGYVIVFNSNKEFLAEEFDEFLLKLKSNEEKYQQLIRRYIG